MAVLKLCCFCASWLIPFLYYLASLTDFLQSFPLLQFGLSKYKIHLDMASGTEAETVASENALKWAQKDKRRFLHAVYRVGDLDRTIKFYTECFGMQLLRKRDIPEEKYANAFLGFGPEDSHFAVNLNHELLQVVHGDYGVDKYDIGTGFGHFAIATEDVYKLVENVREKGGKVTREPGPVKGGTTVIAFVQDPDGYLFELIQRGPTPEPLCQVMLRVGDLECSIKFYEKYTIAMLGYADEYETTVLELTYNYGVTEYTKGNAYAQVAISTEDVYKSAEVVDLVTKELGGKITRQPGPIPGINTKITSFLDPDGWKVDTVLVEILYVQCFEHMNSTRLLIVSENSYAKCFLR
ncbi:putative Lactoylglutathione lyase [Cocos nucifera]|uniref:lactoylglutathione lyase n=1 Tax=Cocos nucifera TaxID=13894 RepID=A0A8K0NAK3_COCNU|nr:putative Lactoylglutathione lyase [Cocos nucifera]